MSKLLNSLPVGALVKDTETKYYDVPIIWKIMEHNHPGDPENSTSLITDKIITFKCFDAAENEKYHGNNRWKYSNIRQWLNSDEIQWYMSQHDTDTSPSESTVTCNAYINEKGFLSNFSVKMKKSLITSSRRVTKNTITDGGGYEDLLDKIFLLSSTEVGFTNENSIAEGNKYILFNTEEKRIAFPTIESINNTQINNGMAINYAETYFLRTPNSNSSMDIGAVTSKNVRGNFNAFAGAGGIRPACCISSSILVSDDPDSDGVYTIIWNENTEDNKDEEDDANVSNSSMILWVDKSKNIIKIYPNVGENSKMVVIDNLESTDSTIALSANQGRILSEMIGDIGTMLDTINRKVI